VQKQITHQGSFLAVVKVRLSASSLPRLPKTRQFSNTYHLWQLHSTITLLDDKKSTNDTIDTRNTILSPTNNLFAKSWGLDKESEPAILSHRLVA
jgi:hypothetical protein